LTVELKPVYFNHVDGNALPCKSPSKEGAFLPLFEHAYRRTFPCIETAILAGGQELVYYNNKHQIPKNKYQISTKGVNSKSQAPNNE
jgi:hypothetical protein